MDGSTPAIPDKTVSRKGSDAYSMRRKNSDICASTINPEMLPVHPVLCMQGPFEESIMESTEPIAKEQLMKLDAEARRRHLLDSEDDDETQYQHSRWQQKPEAKFHPLWKLIAQISFGIHLIHKKLAVDDLEVVSLLQQHVDEVDGFVEDTTADFDLAIRDIEERIRFLSLPFDHNRTFNKMLCDKQFRNAIIDGNDIIRRILDRTRDAMKSSLHDIARGHDATLELAKFLQRLEPSMNRDQQLLDVFIAMRGNAEGWRRCFKLLRQKAERLEKLMVRLEEIVDEIAKRAGIASRRKTPTGVLGNKNRNSEPEKPVPSLRRDSGGGSTRDKPLPPEPPKKTLSTRSARVQSTPSEVSQPARSSSVNANPSQPQSLSQPQSQQPQQRPTKPQHSRASKSLSLPKSAQQKVTFAEGVKSPGPSTPINDPNPAPPRRRSRSQQGSSREIEVATDHVATTALIDRTSATPLTADSERRPSLPGGRSVPSSAYMSVETDEQLSPKNLGDRPASSSIDILFDGQERTPREEIALVLKSLGHDLYAIPSIAEEELSPTTCRSSPRSPMLPSPSVFSNPSPFSDGPSPNISNTNVSDTDATVATSDSSERLPADTTSDDEALRPPVPSAAKKKAITLMEELDGRLAIQSTPDSIPLEGIPLSTEAYESIKSAEEESDGCSEVDVYHIPSKIVELSPIIESRIALDDTIEQYQLGSSPRRDQLVTVASASADNLLLSGRGSEPPPSGNYLGRRGSDSSATSSRRLLGEKVSNLVGKYTHLDLRTKKEQSKPALHPLSAVKPSMSLSPVPEAVDSENASDAQDPPALNIDAVDSPDSDEDLASPTTETALRPETPTTPKEDVSKLSSADDDRIVDLKRLDPWDHRDSILKTPPGYVRRDRLDLSGADDREDSLERPSSFYLNPSRESSVASIIEAADEALYNAVTVPLPASRPGSSIAVPRIIVVPEQGQQVPKVSQEYHDQAQSPDSSTSTDTVRNVEHTELASAPPVPAMDLDIELTASPTGGTRVRAAPTSIPVSETIKLNWSNPSRRLGEYNGLPLPSAQQAQRVFERRDSGQTSASSASDPSEIVRVAVDMMPAFWPGQDRDSLLLDIGLLPGRDVTSSSNSPVELPETKDGPRIPVELDQEEPSRRLRNLVLPKLETGMATNPVCRNIVEPSNNTAFGSAWSSSTQKSGPPRSHPRAHEYADTALPLNQAPATSAKANIAINEKESRLSVKTIRSEPDLRASAALDGTSAARENSKAESIETSQSRNRLSSRPDSQSIGHNPGLSQSSSPTVGSPGPGEDRSQRPSLISPSSETPVFSGLASTSRNVKRLAKPGNGSTSTLPSYLGESSLNCAETLYIPRGAEAHQQMAGEEAEISDETTALPRMLTSSEPSAVKKRLSYKRPNLNNLKGLSQRGINLFSRKPSLGRGTSGETSSLSNYFVS